MIANKKISKEAKPDSSYDLSDNEDDVDENGTFTDPEHVEAPEEDVYEVTQTREMKRKGIRLPKGWKILGKRTESEIESHGESYKYFRIDWQFKSPSGKVYSNLKQALSVIKQNAAKYERWEVSKPKRSEKYVTLKQQYEDELDRALDVDVYAVRYS